jgi:hypothetical protein
MEQLAINTGTDGFCHSTSPVATRPNCLTAGSKNLILTGAGKVNAHEGIASVAGKLGARSLFQIPDGGYAGLGSGSTSGVGSIFGLIARAIAFIGATSNLVINGVSRAVNASTALQILLYVSGSYSGAGTGPFTAGIDQMDAPTIAVTPNASTVNSGTTSLVTWFVRSATGGRGKKSSPSAVLVVSNFKVRATISGSDLTNAAAEGYDRIGIGVTKWGFGATGPHYELIEIAISSLTTVDGVGNSYELEWASAELEGASLAPLDDDPPPPAVFGAALEDVVAAIGAYGDTATGVSATSPGTAIAVSLPVFIESFPPDNLLFLPGAPVGVLPVPSGGFAFIGGLNYMCALTYTGGSPALSLQTLWATIGIASQSAMFLGEGGRLYVFSNGKRGIVRLGEQGEPDESFASDVADYVASWNAQNVVGGRDNDFKLNVFCHGREAVAYNSQLGRWCAPLDFSNQLTANEVICAAIPVGGTLYLASRDTVSTGTALKLWTLHGGTGTTWDAYFPWNRSQLVSDDIDLVELAVRADNVATPVQLKIYINGEESTPKVTENLTLTGSAGKKHLIKKAGINAAKSHRVHIRHTSQGGDSGPEAVRITGDPSGVVW